MKLSFLSLFLIFLIYGKFYNCTFSNIFNKFPDIEIMKSLKIKTASFALADLLKILGSDDTVLELALRIEKKCNNNKLLKIWIKIVKLNKNAIWKMTRRPFIYSKFWLVHHNRRRKILQLFLKSFIKCGNVKGTDKAINKIIKTYVFNQNPLILVNFINLVKKIFYRRKGLNNSIYSQRLLRKIIKLEKMNKTCLKYSYFCKIFRYRCLRKKFLCKLIPIYRDTFIMKVRKVFTFFFSRAFSKIVNKYKI